jgi:hypothetical protein
MLISAHKQAPASGGAPIPFHWPAPARIPEEISMAAPEPKRPTYVTEAIPSDVKNGLFLGNPALDNVVNCMIAMGAELWSTKRRLHVMESVMAKTGITSEMIEKYVPTEAEKAAWESDRDRFVDLTLGPLANEGYRPVGSDFPKR